MTPELMFWLVGLLIVILSGGAALAWLIVVRLLGARVDVDKDWTVLTGFVKPPLVFAARPFLFSC